MLLAVNGVDPMDVVDKYGADALRWFLLNGTAPGQDTRYDPKKLSAAWNFINKIWNASRFVIMNLPADAKPAHMPDVSKFDLYSSSKAKLKAKRNKLQCSIF